MVAQKAGSACALPSRPRTRPAAGPASPPSRGRPRSVAAARRPACSRCRSAEHRLGVGRLEELAGGQIALPADGRLPAVVAGPGGELGRSERRFGPADGSALRLRRVVLEDADHDAVGADEIDTPFGRIGLAPVGVLMPLADQRVTAVGQDRASRRRLPRSNGTIGAASFTEAPGTGCCSAITIARRPVAVVVREGGGHRTRTRRTRVPRRRSGPGQRVERGLQQRLRRHRRRSRRLADRGRRAGGRLP